MIDFRYFSIFWIVYRGGLGPRVPGPGGRGRGAGGWANRGAGFPGPGDREAIQSSGGGAPGRVTGKPDVGARAG